jgi:hypothetical protein
VFFAKTGNPVRIEGLNPRSMRVFSGMVKKMVFQAIVDFPASPGAVPDNNEGKKMKKIF